MLNVLKIGFLNPYSGVYPNYAQHIMAGILIGMGLDPGTQQQVQFVPAYTNMGDVKSTLEAAKKLIFFDQVDIISGLISFHAMPDLKVLLEGKNKLSFFFNMGENFPRENLYSPEIFINSQSIWQSQFVLGKWAQKEFGGTGICIMPFYESGYDLFAAFKKGTECAGGAELGFSVIPQDSGNSSKMDLTDFFTAVSVKQPSYVHAIFCGKMGNEFIRQWNDQDFSQSIPLVVIENMAYEDMLEDVANLNLNLYAVSSWSKTSELPENVTFVKIFEGITGHRSNVFALAGYETGLAIKEIQSFIEKKDLSSARYFLNHHKISGPRADRNFNLLNHTWKDTLDILSIKLTNNNIYRTILDQDKGVDFTLPEFADILQEEMSGWQNPYMCI